MSYVTGFALGISAGKKMGQMFQSKGFELLHALPQRRRYYYEKLVNNEELAISLKREISIMPAIRGIKINAGAGTVLLEYSCTDQEIDLFLGELHKVCNSPNSEGKYARLGTQIRRSVSGTNEFLRNNTQQTLDVKTLAAIVFAAFGTYKVWTLGQRPAGPQMLWWAYCLLKGR